MSDYITAPRDIETRSFEIIAGELGPRAFRGEAEAKIVKRIIHTTADFDFADLTRISDGAIEAGMAAIREGAHVVTDTRMAAAGINRARLSRHGGEIRCFMADGDVAAEAEAEGITRAMVSMRKAARDAANRVFAIGNAPTALFALGELIARGDLAPALVIGVPVGFVGAAESKAALEKLAVPHIVTRGRKGGSAIAACIVNAILYMM
ncbi:MAG: precorrin-8X methylmutase [Candidatus Accumulibacter sp.]|jgi:precorrin-8X/cobalt-precorrin-8 methylmutase|nr:precorrin-8X methylmutase [Accumulibacter sp.]